MSRSLIPPSLLILALEAKGATQPCQRCGGRQFETVGETEIPMQHETVPRGATMPVMVVACPQCGALTLHATQIVTEP